MLPSLLPPNKIHIKEHAQMEYFLGYLENLKIIQLARNHDPNIYRHCYEMVEDRFVVAWGSDEICP